MKWTQKNTLDLILMIIGSLIGTALYFSLLASVNALPVQDWIGLVCMAVNSLMAGLTFRFAVWKLGYRKKF